MVIDSHVHIERKSEGCFYSAQEIVNEMDTAGIDVSIIYGNDQASAGTCPSWAQDEIVTATDFSDEDVAEFCSHNPDRFIGIGSVHPDRYRPERKARNAVENLGLRGVKLYPHSGFYSNDVKLYPMYAYCQEKGVPVIIHTGIKAVRWQHMKYNNPLYIDDVATDFPGLNIIMCHGGYPWTEEFFAVIGTNKNVCVDITFLDYIEKRFSIKNHVKNTMGRLFSVIGSKRLIWGTEGPVMNLPIYGTHNREYYKRSQEYLVQRFEFFSEEDRQNILGENARRLFLIK
jgi:predicted TIM-barrel fold metal-dependent hydrolase